MQLCIYLHHAILQIKMLSCNTIQIFVHLGCRPISILQIWRTISVTDKHLLNFFWYWSLNIYSWLSLDFICFIHSNNEMDEKYCSLTLPSKIKTKYSCFKGNPWMDILYTCFCQYVIFAALVTSLKCIRELSYVDTAALRSTKYTWCEDEERKRLRSSTRGWKSEEKRY